MILEEGEPIVSVYTGHKFKRKRRAGATVDIVTEPENKRYRISFLKRRRMHDHSSFPLGYILGGTGGENCVTADPPWAMI